MKKRIVFILAAILVAGSITACQQSGGTATPTQTSTTESSVEESKESSTESVAESDESPACESLEISIKNNELTVGEKSELTVKCLPTNADVAYDYTSDNVKAIVVDQKGNLTAKADGTANITVTDKNTGVSASTKVTVKKAEDKKTSTEKKTESKTEDKKTETSNGGSTSNGGGSGSGGSSGGSTVTTPSGGSGSGGSGSGGSTVTTPSGGSNGGSTSSKPSGGSGSTGNSGGSSTSSSKKISLDLEDMTLTAGDTTTLSGYLTVDGISNYLNRASVYDYLSCSSSDNDIVEYVYGGEICAYKAGSATLTVTYNGPEGKATSKCKITVKANSSSSNNGSNTHTAYTGDNPNIRRNGEDVSWLVNANLPTHISPEGKVCYEFIPVLDEINAARRQAGVNEVVWYSVDNVYKVMNQELHDYIYGVNNSFSAKEVEINKSIFRSMLDDDDGCSYNGYKVVYDATNDTFNIDYDYVKQEVNEYKERSAEQADLGVYHKYFNILNYNFKRGRDSSKETVPAGAVDNVLSSTLGHREILLHKDAKWVYAIICEHGGLYDFYIDI